MSYATMVCVVNVVPVGRWRLGAQKMGSTLRKAWEWEARRTEDGLDRSQGVGVPKVMTKIEGLV